MPNNSSVKKNALLSTIQTVFSLLFPVITFPYASRVLGVEAIGEYNFSQTYVNYFVLIAGLGISTYAIREGARLRADKKAINSFASEMFSINVYSTIISIFLMLILLVSVEKFHYYSRLILILSIQIVFITIGCNWVFSIYEDYLYISIRTILCQAFGVLLLFLLVKGPEDIWKYCIISVFGIVGSNFLNLFFIRKYCKIKFLFRPNTHHIKPILLIFSMTLSIVIYTNTDITILGFFSSDRDIGLYSVSVKIYSIIKQVLAASLTVTIPRFSYYIGQNKLNEYHALFGKAFNTLLTILLPSSCGLVLLSKEIIVLVSGVDYIGGTIALRFLGVSLVFNLISYLYGYAVMIPSRKETVFFFATLCGAVVNFVLNLVLIPLYSHNAAAFTTLLSDIIVMSICIMKSKEVFQYRLLEKNQCSVFAGTVLVAIICIVCKYILNSSILVLGVSIPLSCVAYCAIMLRLRNPYFENAVNSVFRKIRK